MSSESSEHRPTGLMSLPLEIRLDIYSYLFDMPAYSRHRTCDAKVHANVLRVNKQINYEATQFLYSTQTFLAHPNLLASFPRLRAWYDPVKTASVLPRIRKFHVDIRLDCDLPYEEKAVIESFSGLDELDIDIQQSMYLGVGHGNLAKFEGVRGVKKVRIHGSTTGFEEYLLWLEAAMKSEPDAKIEPYVERQTGWAERLTHIHVF
ncbi:hypothetical protein G7046_g7864 [Stylonectria norvegica]|nr:hypothetical protein G7046_g7864 [Stylonectria norvegica]